MVCEDGKGMALAPLSSSVTTYVLVVLNRRPFFFLTRYFRFSQLGLFICLFIYSPLVGMCSCGRDLQMGVTCSLYGGVDKSLARPGKKQATSMSKSS
jgi:hypothetical protein